MSYDGPTIDQIMSIDYGFTQPMHRPIYEQLIEQERKGEIAKGTVQTMYEGILKGVKIERDYYLEHPHELPAHQLPRGSRKRKNQKKPKKKSKSKSKKKSRKKSKSRRRR